MRFLIKPRPPRISGIFEEGATQPDPGSPTRQPRWGGGGMQRRPNAVGLSPRAAWHRRDETLLHRRACRRCSNRPITHPMTRLRTDQIHNPLGGESEVDDVAVLDRVLLAFETDLTVIAAGGHRAAGNQMVVGDDLRADEPARDVAVNLPGGELRLRVARNRPGTALVLADGEERDVAEQIVAGADHAIEPRLVEAQIG